MSRPRSGLASGSMWSIVDNLAQQILSFLIFAVLARLLAPDDLFPPQVRGAGVRV